MMKEDSGVSNAQAWGCPGTPTKYSRRLKRLSLGMPPCIPFFINNHQFVLLHTIFLLLHMICAVLGASVYYLLVLFCFVCWSLQCRTLPCLIGRDTRSTL